MSGWLPPGVTDADIDRACPGYYDEPDDEEPELHECERCGRQRIIEQLEERNGRRGTFLICLRCLEEGPAGAEYDNDP